MKDKNSRSPINLIAVETPQRVYSPWLVLPPTTVRKGKTRNWNGKQEQTLIKAVQLLSKDYGW